MRWARRDHYLLLIRCSEILFIGTFIQFHYNSFVEDSCTELPTAGTAGEGSVSPQTAPRNKCTLRETRRMKTHLSRPGGRTPRSPDEVKEVFVRVLSKPPVQENEVDLWWQTS